MQNFRILSRQGVETKLSSEETSGAQSFPKIYRALDTKAFSALSPHFPARPNMKDKSSLCIGTLLPSESSTLGGGFGAECEDYSITEPMNDVPS